MKIDIDTKNIVGKILGNSKPKLMNDKISMNEKEPKPLPPQPKYCKCNKGHTLTPVYNEKRHSMDWDCQICIDMMEAERKKHRR